MAREIPASPRVYTTTYDNFRGVDFTNDQTNVWKRRSPTGVNMLPDSAGRPFKRNGWEILLSNDDLKVAFADYYADAIDETAFNESKTTFFLKRGNVYDRCTEDDAFDSGATYYRIQKLPPYMRLEKSAYFEIAGVDHIVIFTNCGVLFYNGVITDINKEYDCYSSYERCFFFEGNGTSAFYIYGNFRVWRYTKDFILEEATDELTVPLVVASATADGTGELIQGYNLLGNISAIQFYDVSLYTWWASDNLIVTVKDGFKTGKTQGNPAVYRWRWESGSWVTKEGSTAFDSTNILVSGTKEEGDEIVILYAYGVLLPNNVAQGQINKMKANYTTTLQFDSVLDILPESEKAQLTTNKCVLYTDATQHREAERAWIIFDRTQASTWDASQHDMQDIVRIEFPSVKLDSTDYTDVETEKTFQASLVGV